MYVLQKINIYNYMTPVNLVFDYTYSAFKVLDPIDDDGHG